MNKQGGMTDIFLFLVISVIVVFISVIFIYIGGQAYSEIKEKSFELEGIAGDKNVTEIVDNSIGKVNQAYQSLYWISVMLIVGMIVSIFISSYLVTTKPVFFIPYIFLTIIAVIVSVGISNAYELVMQDPTLASTFVGFIGANFIMLHLPLWIVVIGIGGAVIMFARMGNREAEIYGGYQ
jgi:F0F1-type ATP synthase assembly protein I